jgi:hypothetical protein
MPGEMPDNIERLREAGFTIKTPLPEEYEQVLEDLSEAEMDELTKMDALNSLMARLDKARLERASVTQDADEDDHKTWILPP